MLALASKEMDALLKRLKGRSTEDIKVLTPTKEAVYTPNTEGDNRNYDLRNGALH
jgi:hypothetical protein